MCTLAQTPTTHNTHTTHNNTMNNTHSNNNIVENVMNTSIPVYSAEFIEVVQMQAVIVLFAFAAFIIISAWLINKYSEKRYLKKLDDISKKVIAQNEQHARAMSVMVMEKREQQIALQKTNQIKRDHHKNFQDMIFSIASMSNSEIWEKFDKKDANTKAITAEAIRNACEAWNATGDASFFWDNATIQGIRAFWLAINDMSEYARSNNNFHCLYKFFLDFIDRLEKILRRNDSNYCTLVSRATWSYGPNSLYGCRILTKAECEALDCIVQKKGWNFFRDWYLPDNDAATGGLLLAMSKDFKFMEEMAEIKSEGDFWNNPQMKVEKSLWKANQWKTYLARYNKVKQLKEDMWPIFAREEIATCKLTTDVVVGFKFGNKEFEICDVADTKQIEKILAAGYDQVLRIRRTTAKGIWEESQQINRKYSGTFCTGRGTEQSHGYYQSDFLTGTTLPWVADIQINGEWDNFGVILTNSAGVVDYGMGNDNRSDRHRKILYTIFGDGTTMGEITAGQREVRNMAENWFTHREFNINHAVAEIKAKLEPVVNNDVW